MRNQSLNLINGVCLPATCSPQRVVQFTNRFLLRADLIAVAAQCQTSNDDSIEAIDIVAM